MHSENSVFLPVAGRVPGSRLDPSSALRRRPLFWLALSFCGGIFLDDLLQPSLPALGGACITVALGVLAALALFPARPSGPPFLARARFALAAALLASLACGALQHALSSRFPGACDVSRRTPQAPALAWIEGTVAGVVRGTPERAERWTLELEALGTEPGRLTPASGLLQLTRKQAADGAPLTPVAEGDRLRTLVRLEGPETAALPEHFDPAAYLARLGIRRVGETAAEGHACLAPAGWWRADLWLRRWGALLARRNTERLGVERAALLNALLLGSREGLDSSDREAFARAGTAHLLAISGLHFQAAAALLWWFLARLGWSRRRSGCAVLVFVASYALFVGAQPPVMRSALTIAIYIGAIILRRPADPLSTLGAAALLLLAFQPGELFLAGFQLTFLAVLALVILCPALEAAWRQWRGIPEEWIVDPGERLRLKGARALRGALFVSFAAWVGTAPAVAWHMGYFTPLGLLVNLIAVPLSLVAMAGGGCSMLPGASESTALTSLWVAPLDLLMGLNRAMGGWLEASFDVPAPPAALCLAYAGLIVWAWIARGRAATLPKLLLILAAALGSLAATSLFRAPLAAPCLTVLDLARGRAALIETPGGEAAVIDAGGAGQGRRIVERLRRQGVRAVALLVITEDSTEAHGGALELLERVTVRRVVLPRSAAPSVELRALEAELERRALPYGPPELAGSLRGPGDLRWEFSTDAPAARPPRAGSEALSLRVTLGHASVLFAHARSSAGVRRLLDGYGERLAAEVLRLFSGPGGHWPAETALLAVRCGAQTIVAGEGRELPEEGTGFDLAAFAQSKGLRLLSPHRDGSLRWGEARAASRLEAFRGGRWQEVPWP